MYGYYKALADASESCTAYSMTWVPPEPSPDVYGHAYPQNRCGDRQGEGQAEQCVGDEKKRMQNQISYWENAKKLF